MRLRWPWGMWERVKVYSCRFIWCVHSFLRDFGRSMGSSRRAHGCLELRRGPFQEQMHQIVERQDWQHLAIWQQQNGSKRIKNGWTGRNARNFRLRLSMIFHAFLLRYSNPSKSSLPPEGEWTLEGSNPQTADRSVRARLRGSSADEIRAEVAWDHCGLRSCLSHTSAPLPLLRSF